MSDPGYIKSTVDAIPSLAWRLPTWPKFSIQTLNVGNIAAVGGIRTQYSGLAAQSETGVAKLWQLAAGGHQIDNANAVFMLDLYQDVLTWVQDRAASSPAVQAAAAAQHLTTGFDPHHYSDGLPCSAHSYWCDCFINVPGHGPYAIRVQQRASFPSATSSDISDVYDVVAKEWVLPSGTAFPQGVSAFGRGGAAGPAAFCQDPRTQNIYYANGSISARFNTSTWVWEDMFGDTSMGGTNYQASCVDTVRNKWVQMGYDSHLRGGGVDLMKQMDLTTGARTNVALVPDPAHGYPLYYEYNGCCFDEDNALIWTATGDPTSTGNGLWTVDSGTGQCTYIGRTPEVDSGPCTRLRYFKALGGIFLQAESAAQFYVTR